MNTSTRPTLRRTVGAVATATLLAGFAPSTAGTAGTSAPGEATPPSRCSWSVDQLPHTADAVEGWYRGCDQP